MMKAILVAFVCLVITPYGAEAKRKPRHHGYERSVHEKFDHSSYSHVRSRSGVSVRVHPSAVAKLQCVVNYVESAGVRIKYMRGYGRGTVRGSLHPSGRAIDINQYARGRTRPHINASVAAGATRTCGVVGGESWRNRDDGHWNL